MALRSFILDLDARRQNYDFTKQLRDELDRILKEEDAWEELKQQKRKEVEHA
jgi:hypothetical protein